MNTILSMHKFRKGLYTDIHARKLDPLVVSITIDVVAQIFDIQIYLYVSKKRPHYYLNS